MSEKPGMAAAVETLADAGAVGRIDREPELPLGLSRAERASQLAGYRGPGRPKGSRNRRTEETIEYLRAKGVADPLEVLGQIYSRPTAELAEELDISLAEALDRQQHAAQAALPFWHAKVNPNIALKADKDGFMLWIGDEMPEGAADQGGDEDGFMLDAEVIENDEKSDT